MTAHINLFLRLALATTTGLLPLGILSQKTQPVSDPVTAPLAHGRLVIWIVHPASHSWTPENNSVQSPIQLPKTVQEQTSGSFGQPSSDFGQTAGSFGASPSEVGTAASNVGQTAGSVGQGPQGFGQDSSNVGQTAGSYGQTAGSFGESLSTIAQATDHPSASRLYQRHTSQWDTIVVSLRGVFPGLEIKLSDVREEDLAPALRDVAGSTDSPDVLLGSPLPWTWTKTKTENGSGWRLVLASLGAVAFPVQVEDAGMTMPSQYPWSPQVAILAHANHMQQAKAFAVWISDGGPCAGCATPVSPTLAPITQIALAAVRSVLTTGSPDSSVDPEFARADADWTRTGALQGLHVIPLEGMQLHSDVMEASANDRFALVQVRTTVRATQGFGTLHSLVLLRKDQSTGHWRVLHLTPDLPIGMGREAISMLDDFTAPAPHPAKVGGIRQAAPADDDAVGTRPELWWDNNGGAGLELVEWQRGTGNEDDRWAAARLFFVPDRDPHLRTRVTADFATDLGTYRWRVWSLGVGGVIVLSPWKTMEIDH
ncbi:MAG: hypothetical protein PW735_01085 [Acidobacteriaceae bacterium]|nr:hypothetical protein [Acidobacteriaceae bacterium]